MNILNWAVQYFQLDKTNTLQRWENIVCKVYYCLEPNRSKPKLAPSPNIIDCD